MTAYGYVTLNVGFPSEPSLEADHYATHNVGFPAVPSREAYDYPVLNLATGVGVALYPWREDPARPPRVRR